MDISFLLELDRLAKASGRRLAGRRSLFDSLRNDSGRHFIGISGPRGAGKTILLQQLAAESKDGCYVSLDTLAADTDLFALLKELKERYGFRCFFLDEVHFLKNGLGALKKIYDFLEVRVIFTSSVALQMKESAHDLARRVRIYALDYFSFREYLAFSHGVRLPRLSVEDYLAGHINPDYLQVADRWEAYLTGGLMPFSLEEPEPLPLLKSTVETIIARDIPTTLRLHMDELETLRKLIAFVGRSGVDGINYSSLSNNLGITKYKAEQYVSAFEDAFLLLPLFPYGTNLLREPKVLLMPPLRLLYRPLQEVRCGLREDFVALAMRQAGIPLHYLKGTRGQKTPDFHIRHDGANIVLEVGGKGKGRTQFKGFQADRKIVLAEATAPAQDRLPLHLLGFLA
jgi:predicted AAA+ superfamily ATPase